MNFSFNASETYSFPPSCGEGALLDEGFDQQEALGRLYRSYLVDNAKILPDKFNPDLVHIQASHFPRCIESAIGFMQGMYPPEDPGEILNMTSGNASNEVLCPYVGGGPAFLEAGGAWMQTDEFKARTGDSEDVLSKLREYHNITLNHIVEYLLVGEYFVSYKCHGLGIEPVDKPLFKRLVSNMAFFEAGFLNFSKPLGSGPIWNMVFDDIDKYYGLESQTKFTLFSGHDVTLAAILVSLGYVDLVAPAPYASHLAVEIWYTTRPEVRVVLNGKVIPVNGRELTPLSEFKPYIMGGD